MLKWKEINQRNSSNGLKPQTTFATHINIYNEMNAVAEKGNFNTNEGIFDYSSLEEEKNSIFSLLEKEKEQRKTLVFENLSLKNYIGADCKWILKEFV